MVVLVTGASGHLGNVLARSLLEQGHEVRVLIRRPNPPAIEGLNVERVHGDLFDLDALNRACDGADWVFHSAASISTIDRDAKLLERVNVVGTRNMIEAALRVNVERFIYVSSVEALDLHTAGEVVSADEFQPEHSIMYYGRTKARATLEVLDAVRERGLPAVVGVPSGLIGPYDFGSSRTAEVVRRFLTRRLPAYVEGAFDFVDVRDVAEGLIAAAQRGEIGERYLLTGELLSYFEMTQLLEEISGVPMSHLRVPYWLALPYTYVVTAVALLLGRSPLYTPNSLRILQTRPRFDLSKSSAHLGYAPRPMQETLADTIAWVKGSVAAARRGTG